MTPQLPNRPPPRPPRPPHHRIREPLDPHQAALAAARQSWRARLALVERNLTHATDPLMTHNAREVALARALTAVRALIDDPTDQQEPPDAR